MAFRSSLAILALGAGLALSQTTSITSAFLPGLDSQTLLASVVSVAPTATTFFVNCPRGSADECGIGEGITLVEGPSTMNYLLVDPGAFTLSASCVISGDVATCTTSAGGTDANFPGTSVDTVSGIKSVYLPVTITAGLSALATATGGASPTAAASTTVRPTATVGTLSQTGSQSASGSSTAAAASASSSTSKAGSPQVTQNALVGLAAALVAGGVAAL